MLAVLMGDPVVASSESLTELHWVVESADGMVVSMDELRADEKVATMVGRWAA